MAKVVFATRAYNDEKYIARCIESIRNQTETDWYYDLEDNGSTDQTKEICEKYSELDDRIHLFRFEENSFSAERLFSRHERLYNTMERVGAEYICWLDSDDWYEPDLFSKMYAASENGKVDYIVCGSAYHDEDGNLFAYRTSIDYSDRISGRKITGVEYCKLMPSLTVTWAKFFSKEAYRCYIELLRNRSKDIIITNTFDDYSSKMILLKPGIFFASIKDTLHHYTVKKKSTCHGQNFKGMDEISARIKLKNLEVQLADNFGALDKEVRHQIESGTLGAIIQWLKNINESSEMSETEKRDLYKFISDFVSENDPYHMYNLVLINYLIYHYSGNKDYRSFKGWLTYVVRIWPIPLKRMILRCISKK